MKRSLLPLSLLLLAGAAKADTTLTASILSTVTIGNALVAYQSADGSDQNAAGLGTIAAGVPYTATADISGSLTDYLGYRYTLIGTYGEGDSGLIIGLNSVDALGAVGKSFNDVFGTSESSIVADTKSAYKVFNKTATFFDYLNAAALKSFLTDHKSMLAQGVAGGSLVSFSNGANVGTFSVVPQAVPEPATFAVLGLGALALGRRRRRA